MKFTKNDNGQDQATFAAKLLSIGNNVLENINGTKFRVVAIAFEDVNGIEREVTATMYETNYQKGVKVSTSYLTTATKTDDGRIFLQVSHLESLDKRADESMFNFAAIKMEEKVEKSLETKKS